MRRQQGAPTCPIWYIPTAMKKKLSAITIGLDLGDRKHAVCALDAKGEVLKQESITNTPASLAALSRRHPGALMVMEVGMHSPWTSRFLKGLGHLLGSPPNPLPSPRGGGGRSTYYLQPFEPQQPREFMLK